MRNVLMRQTIRHRSAFTLVEMVVSISVLTLLVLLCTRLLNSASTIATTGNKHMDTDNQARPVLDRMAEDISQMVKRADVDYFLKQPGNEQTGPNPNIGKNDQIAFFSQVEGYYPTNSQSHLSLVAYRLNSDSGVTTASLNKLERLGKGLIWNGDLGSITDTPIVFAPIPIATPSSLPPATGTPTPAWPQAGNMAVDPDGHYEVVGPEIFRFEYYYQLRLGNLWDKPWDDTRDNDLDHNTVSGLRDVGAIVVVIATIDPKSRVLVSDAQLSSLAGQLVDYSVFDPPGQSERAGKVGPALTATWQDAVNKNTLNLPPTVLAGIHMYERYLYLNGQQQ
jgi:type II secretory pathway component PulJ